MTFSLLNLKLVSFKVTVASSDGKFINQYFGMASQFLIFEIKDDGTYEFLELRKNKSACSVKEHSELSMEKKY